MWKAAFWDESVWDVLISEGGKGLLFDILFQWCSKACLYWTLHKIRGKPQLWNNRGWKWKKNFPWELFSKAAVGLLCSALPRRAQQIYRESLRDGKASWASSSRAASSSVAVSGCKDSPLGLNPKTTDHLVQGHSARMSPLTFPTQSLPKLFYLQNKRKVQTFLCCSKTHLSA